MITSDLAQVGRKLVDAAMNETRQLSRSEQTEAFRETYMSDTAR